MKKIPPPERGKSAVIAPPTPATTPAPGTRRAILDLLKRGGEATAGELAGELGLTPMAARLQLYDLQKEGLADARDEARGRGRPVKLWALTDRAARIFPDAHQGLAVEMIRSIEALFGAEGLAKVVARHGAAQRDAYAARLSGAKTLGEKVKRLAAIRDEEGYMAEARRDGADWLLIENHCPVCSAARACTQLCANELQVFKGALGAGVAREDHILAGARRCVYRVRSLDGQGKGE